MTKELLEHFLAVRKIEPGRGLNLRLSGHAADPYLKCSFVERLPDGLVVDLISNTRMKRVRWTFALEHILAIRCEDDVPE